MNKIKCAGLALLFLSLSRNVDASTQLELLVYSTQVGDITSQARRGIIHAPGVNGNDKIDEPIKWLNQSADQENAETQYNLGVLYLNDFLVPPDYQNALKLFMLSAANGKKDAQYNHIEGLVVAVNRTQAEQSFEQAAGNGNVLAQYELGMLNSEGKVVALNYPQPLGWLNRASTQGYSLATDAIATIFWKGLGLQSTLQIHPGQSEIITALIQDTYQLEDSISADKAEEEIRYHPQILMTDIEGPAAASEILTDNPPPYADVEENIDETTSPLLLTEEDVDGVSSLSPAQKVLQTPEHEVMKTEEPFGISEAENNHITALSETDTLPDPQEMIPPAREVDSAVRNNFSLNKSSASTVSSFIDSLKTTYYM